MSEAKKLTAERLAKAHAIIDAVKYYSDERGRVGGLLADAVDDIAALEAELAELRRPVGDEAVRTALELLAHQATKSTRVLSVDDFRSITDLLTRLERHNADMKGVLVSYMTQRDDAVREIRRLQAKLAEAERELAKLQEITGGILTRAVLKEPSK